MLPNAFSYFCRDLANNPGITQTVASNETHTGPKLLP
jgi:hypothetical protein